MPVFTEVCLLFSATQTNITCSSI